MTPVESKHVNLKVSISAILIITLLLFMSACRHSSESTVTGNPYYVLDPGSYFQQSKFSVSLDQSEYFFSAPYSHTIYIPKEGPAIGVAINTVGDYWQYDGIVVNITIKVHGDKVFDSAGIPPNTIFDLSKPSADYRINVSATIADTKQTLGAGMGGSPGAGSMGRPNNYKYGVWVGDLDPLWENDPVTEWLSGSDGTLTVLDFRISTTSTGLPEFKYNLLLKDVVLHAEFNSDLVQNLPIGTNIPNFIVINSASFCVSDTGCS